MKRFEKKKWVIILTLLVTLSPLFVGLILWNKLPAEIPTHYGITGEPDGYSSKAMTVFGVAPLMLRFQLLILYVLGKDHKTVNLSKKVLNLVIWIIPVLSLYNCLMVYGKALDLPISISKLTVLLLGLLFMFIGNYLPKTRQNHTVGIRLPWTLKSVDNWNKVNRLSGYLWMITGALICISVLFNETVMWIITLVLFIISGAVPTVYSYQLSKKEK
jgi:uncharacterized membrane protein